MLQIVKDLKGRYQSAIYAFLLCLALTFGATYFAYRSSRVENVGRFDRSVTNILNSLRNRMTVYMNALIYTRNLFDVKADLSHAEFKDFVRGMKLQQNFPGIQTMGYVERLTRKDAEKRLAMMGKSFSDAGTPKGAREIDLIVYFEQLGEGGKSTIVGMDLAANPIRKAAMNTARDLGVPVATDRVQPITAPQSDAYVFLLFVPRYRPLAKLTTVEERRKALLGFVYGGFRTTDLFGRISNDMRMQNTNLGVRIYDGLGVNDDRIMYSEGVVSHRDPDFMKTIEFNEANHNWTVQVVAPQDFGLSYLKWSPFFVLGLGISLSLAVMFSMMKGQKLSARLKAAREEADQANQAKSMFLANISHEIRTPLGVIIGFAESALTEASKEKRDSLLKAILRNGNELTRIIGDVLDLSKIEAKTLLIENHAFSLKKLHEELHEAWQDLSRKKGLGFHYEVSKALPEFVESDPVRIKQILVNLLSNALKFTSEGEIHFKISESDGHLVYTVDDSGIGIREESKKKLFRAFSQEDSSITRKYGGSGLGLAISKELAHALGGSVSVETNPKGKGSRFVFRMPIVFADAVVAAKQIQAPDQRILEGKKILLVEDSPDNQDLVDLILKDSGVILSIANNGQEGVESVQREDYDLILMDLQMPVLDGYGALAALKAKDVRIPVVALTAHALKEERDKAMEKGFSAYLTKPIDRSQLLKVSAELLQKVTIV